MTLKELYMLLSGSKCISVFFIYCLSVFWLCGCGYKNRDDKIKNCMSHDNDRKYVGRYVLEVYIPEDEKISIGTKLIEYCEVSQQIKNHLMSDTIVKDYVRVYPDDNTKMSFLNCVIEEVKKAGVDSLSLHAEDRDGHITIRNDQKDKKKYDKRTIVYTMNDYSLIVDGDTVGLNKLEEKIISVLDPKGRNLIFFQTRVGLTYHSYKKYKDVIKRIQKEWGADAVHIEEDMCPYCNQDISF